MVSYELPFESAVVGAKVAGLAGTECRVLLAGAGDTFLKRRLELNRNQVTWVSDALPAYGSYEVVILDGVLERAPNPSLILDHSATLLARNGYVVASVGNLAHGSIRCALLQGRFPYSDGAIINSQSRTFYTLSTLRAVFEAAAYEICEIERERVPLFADCELLPTLWADTLPQSVLDFVRLDPEHETLYYAVKAVPASLDRRHTVRVAAPLRSDRDPIEAAVSVEESREGHEADLIACLDSTRGELADLEAKYRTLQSAIGDMTMSLAEANLCLEAERADRSNSRSDPQED